MAEEEEKRKTVWAESLGWLTESTIMPKKHKAIEGVGASSIFELKAELYKSQEDAKKSKELSGADVEYHRAKKKITANNAFSRKNSGVDARAHQDKLALKAVSDGSASYAALEKKAALYEKLARGELSDEEDKEKYCVDFFRKGQEEKGHQELQANDSSSSSKVSAKIDDYDDFLPFNSKPLGLGHSAGMFDIDEHKRFVREVHEEVNQARVNTSELKLRRQEQAAARREKLRQAYIRKQLEKVKSATIAKQEQA
ncbi:uncharacterized protein At4g18257-like [Chenopodium quinoa]|uniref:uncharacterized protein At4g18257-like n=1 Tax=Chenopodium quinoa TaxID=63459 RepID=UPI000B772DA4|nr:uncharacterized protein At4g18257-like [Chenopodium quinoa]